MKKLVKTLLFSTLILGFSYGALLALSAMNEKKRCLFSTVIKKSARLLNTIVPFFKNTRIRIKSGNTPIC
ncbi:hypothetical protein QS257_15270 [Terrilactibacillus sp. S3-3]|nr:hypothetical protein QS257_15270 [Terrilactibacillus sp. S3-3]